MIHCWRYLRRCHWINA